MVDDPSADERAWAADKRDFVADHRDRIADKRDTQADARDAIADQRDQLADDREAALDESERRLDARAAQLGVPPDDTPAERAHAAAQRADTRRLRDEKRQERDKRRIERDTASGGRQEAAKRREAATPSTGLAMVFADIAQHLYSADTFNEVLVRIGQATVSTVEGCQMASITVNEDGVFRTAASTDAAATKTDQAQYQANEGPCLDAIEDPIVYAPSFPDDRWPTLASGPIESGVHSAVSYRLAAPGPLADGSLAGSLNSYAATPNAFSDQAQEIGLILAAHASVIARAVRERTILEQLGRQLHEALSSRDVIGQAKGILMERLRITPEDAFDALRRSSQRLNRKLREVAQGLTETGEFIDHDQSTIRSSSHPRPATSAPT
jgi:ANTAR domain/GAF domain